MKFEVSPNHMRSCLRQAKVNKKVPLFVYSTPLKITFLKKKNYISVSHSDMCLLELKTEIGRSRIKGHPQLHSEFEVSMAYMRNYPLILNCVIVRGCCSVVKCFLGMPQIYIHKQVCSGCVYWISSWVLFRDFNCACFWFLFSFIWTSEFCY